MGRSVDWIGEGVTERLWSKSAEDGGWTFLTNHALVLLAIARDPDIRIRDIAKEVRITERATQSLLKDLIEDGFVNVQKHGRRNSYQVRPKRHLRHPMNTGARIEDLLALLGSNTDG
jgi:predicted ArsR family transcriptional regulator